MARINIFGRQPENRLRPVWQGTVPDHAIALAWSPDNSRLAVAAVSGPITIFDANTGKPVHQLKGHGFGTAALAWQPTGNLLASVGQDSKIRVWDAATGQEARALDAGASWAEKVLWHPGGQYLATAAGKKARSEEHTSELQSLRHLVCRLLLEKKNRKLEAVGQRSINNHVDLTNLVLFELAQPLHEFDAKKLAGGAIRVRRARAGEALTTLDVKPLTLTEDVPVIADKKRPVARAGVMGGAES